MIQLFVTGGTFDKDYDHLTGQLHFKDTNLRQILSQGRCTVPVNMKTLMMIDSLEMTEEDRMIILKNCEKAVSDNILITHGTDTICETASFLAKAGLHKTIVLTGAIIPFSLTATSDCTFNIGVALAFAQSLPKGVYVAMNGRCFDWDKVQKNRQTGFFEQK